MNKPELVRALEPLNAEQQIQWMVALGSHLTVAARSFYEAGTENAEGPPLRGFNEIQHRVYARIREMSDGRDWTLESFIAMLIEYGSLYKIAGDVDWAIKQSFPKPIN